MSLNKYRSQGGDRNVAKKKDVMKLERHGALLETGACLLASLGLSEEKVKFTGAVTRQQRYPFSNNFNSKWPNRSNFFSDGNNSFQPSQATNSQQPKKSLEESLDQYMKSNQNQIESLSKNQEDSRGTSKLLLRI